VKGVNCRNTYCVIPTIDPFPRLRRIRQLTPLGPNAEDALRYLALAAFQLQAAHVGARMAGMATDHVR